MLLFKLTSKWLHGLHHAPLLNCRFYEKGGFGGTYPDAKTK